MGSVFTDIAVMAASSAPADCVIDTSTYSTTGASNAVSMSSSGSLSIDTSAVSQSTIQTVSVVVGSQTIESDSFSAPEVFDCIPSLTFPSLPPD